MKPRRDLLRQALALYKRTLSPLLAYFGGGGCRFSPTCSEYLVEAIEQRGWFSGLWLGLRRVCRCHPWGGSGYDPIPLSPDSTSSTHPVRCPHCK